MKSNNANIISKKQVKSQKKSRKKNQENKKNKIVAKAQYDEMQKNSSNQEIQSKESHLKSSNESKKSKSDSVSENDSQNFNSSKQQGQKSSISGSEEQEQISLSQKYRISCSEGGKNDNLISNNTKNGDYVDLSKPYRVRRFYKVDEKDPQKVQNYQVYEQIEQEPSSTSKKSSSIGNNNKKSSINTSKNKIYIPNKIIRQSSSQSSGQSQYQVKFNSRKKTKPTSNQISIKSKKSRNKKGQNKLQQKNLKVLRKNSKSSNFSKDQNENFEIDTPSEQKIIQISSSPSQSCKLLSNESQIKKIKKQIKSNKVKKTTKSTDEVKPSKRKNSNNKRNGFSDSQQDQNQNLYVQKEKKKTKNYIPTKKQKNKKIAVPSNKNQKKSKEKQPDFFTSIKNVKPKQQKNSKKKKIQKQVSQQLPKTTDRKNEQGNKNIQINQKQSMPDRIEEEQKISKKLKKDIESLKTTIKNKIPSTLGQMIKMIDENKEQLNKEKGQKFSDQNLDILNESGPQLNSNSKNVKSQCKFGFHHWHLTLQNQHEDYKIVSFQEENRSQQKEKFSEKQKYQQTNQKNYQHYEFSFQKKQQSNSIVKDNTILKLQQSITKQSPQKIDKQSPQAQKQSRNYLKNDYNGKITEYQFQNSIKEVDWFEDIFNEFPKQQNYLNQEIDKLSPQRQIFYGQINWNEKNEEQNDLPFFEPVFSDDSFVDFAQQKGSQQKEYENVQQRQDEEQLRFKEDPHQAIQNVKKIQNQTVQIFSQKICHNQNIEVLSDKIQNRQSLRKQILQNNLGQWVSIFNQNKRDLNPSQSQLNQQGNENSGQEEQCVVNYIISDQEGSEDGEIMIIERLCTKKRGHPIFFHPLSQAVKKQQVKIKQQNSPQNYRNQSEDEFEDNEVMRQLKREFLMNQKMFNNIKKNNESDCSSLSEGQQRITYKRNLQSQEQIEIESQSSSLEFISQKLKKQCRLKKQQYLKSCNQIKNEYEVNEYEKQSGQIDFQSNSQEISQSQGEMRVNNGKNNYMQNFNQTYLQKQNIIKQQSNFNDQFNQFSKRPKKPKHIIQIQAQQPQSGQMTPPERYQLPSYLIPNNQSHKKTYREKSQDIKKPHQNKFSQINNRKKQQYSQFQQKRNHKVQKFPFRTRKNQRNYQQPPKILIKTQQSTNLPSQTKNINLQINKNHQHQLQKIQEQPPLNVNEPKSRNKLQQQKFLQMMQQLASNIQQINQIKKSKIVNLDIVDDDEEAAKKMLQPQIYNQPSQESQNSLDQMISQMKSEVFSFKHYIKTDQMRKNNTKS